MASKCAPGTFVVHLLLSQEIAHRKAAALSATHISRLSNRSHPWAWSAGNPVCLRSLQKHAALAFVKSPRVVSISSNIEGIVYSLTDGVANLAG